jgi:hypothetical protein
MNPTLFWKKRSTSFDVANPMAMFEAPYYTPKAFEKTSLKWKPCIYIYINKDENSSTKNTRHVEANVNTWKKNQDHQNNNNEVKDLMLKECSVTNQLVMKLH